MVDRIRKMFGTKDEDSGNPVGYIESVVSKMDISNMPEPIQKVDLWLRQYIPMKRPEDCLYCKLISCSIITAGTVYIAKIVPKTMKTKYTSTGPRLVYGTFTTVLVVCLASIAVCRWFDIELPESGNNSSFKEHFKQQIFDRKELKTVDAKTLENKDR